MAYPTQSAGKALDEIDSVMLSIKGRAQTASTRLAAGSVTTEYALNIHTDIANAIERLNALKTTPGITELARTLKNDETLNVVTEFTAVLNQLATINTWLENNLPASDGWLSHLKFVDGVLTFNTLTSQQRTTLAGGLNSLGAMILE